MDRRRDGEFIARFGAAELVCHLDGRYELRGGSRGAPPFTRILQEPRRGQTKNNFRSVNDKNRRGAFLPFCEVTNKPET